MPSLITPPRAGDTRASRAAGWRMAEDDYLTHLTRASSSDDDSDASADERQLAAALDGCSLRASSDEEASSDAASSDASDAPLDATPDEIVAAAVRNGWSWSTGGVGARPVDPSASLRAKQKRAVLLPGEKRLLKKRHMAETRAARSAARFGFTPQDAREALERMIRSGIPEWSPPGACGVREAKTIAALARCYPGLTFESDANRASGRKRRVRVVVRNAGNTHRDDQKSSVRTPTRAVLGGDPPPSSTSPAAAAAAAAAARAAAIAAPVPTRREYLEDPDRLARVAAATWTPRGRGRGGDRRERIDPGKRGEGRRVPPASERGRRRDRSDRDVAVGRNPAVSFVSAGSRDAEDANGDANGHAGEFESAASSAAAARRARAVADSASLDDFGEFERHTTGFGSRMLAGMGFVPGEGLGRDGRGAATPLEAKERPARRGLGAE